MVRSGLVTAWRLAGWPTRRSPSSVKATIEGVVRMPSAFSMILGFEPSMTATHELVVPRSMPMTLDIELPLIFSRPPGPVQRPEEQPGVAPGPSPSAPTFGELPRYRGGGDDI